MAILTSTFSNFETISNIVLSSMRYTYESNTPVRSTVESFNLGKGQKTLTIPKAGSAPDFDNLQEGVDITDNKDFSVSTQDLTVGEVGGKFIITDVLRDQFNEDIFAMLGRLAGNSEGRKVEKDLIALWPSLNGGTQLGTSGNPLGLTQIYGLVAKSLSPIPFPEPVSLVAHPIPLMQLNKTAAGVGATYFAGMLGSNEALLRRFFTLSINGVPMYWSHNIAVDTSNDAVGAIYSKSAMAILQAKEWGTEYDRDISLRATEMVCVSRYGVFEIDDTYGASFKYSAAALATTT